MPMIPEVGVNLKEDTSMFLNENDLILMNEIQAIKNHVFNVIDKKKIVEVLVDIVDDSEIVNFKNERSKKFIDHERPILNLVIDKTKMEDVYGEFKPKNEEKESSYYQNVLYGEVISIFSNFINASIKGTEKQKDYLNKHQNIFNKLIENITEEELMKAVTMFTTIFGIRLNNDDKSNVLLELLY